METTRDLLSCCMPDHRTRIIGPTFCMRILCYSLWNMRKAQQKLGEEVFSNCAPMGLSLPSIWTCMIRQCRDFDGWVIYSRSMLFHRWLIIGTLKSIYTVGETPAVLPLRSHFLHKLTDPKEPPVSFYVALMYTSLLCSFGWILSPKAHWFSVKSEWNEGFQFLEIDCWMFQQATRESSMHFRSTDFLEQS